MDHYQFLGVGRAALPATIRAAADRRRRQLTTEGATPQELVRVDSALRILLDPDTRVLYDNGELAEDIADTPTFTTGSQPPLDQDSPQPGVFPPPFQAQPPQTSLGADEPPAADELPATNDPFTRSNAVFLTIPYPESLSRGLLFFKWLFVIPAYIALVV